MIAKLLIALAIEIIKRLVFSRWDALSPAEKANVFDAFKTIEKKCLEMDDPMGGKMEGP